MNRRSKQTFALLNPTFAFLKKKCALPVQDLEGKMKAFAQKQNYEKAGAIRDHIIAIEQTSKRTRKFERNLIGIITSKVSPCSCLGAGG